MGRPIPRAPHASRLTFLLLLPTFLLLAAPAATAREFREIHLGSDQVQGTIGRAVEADLFPFDGVADSRLTLKVKVDKRSDFQPRIRILDSDQNPLPGVAEAIKTNRKGTKLKLKKFPIGETARFFIEIASATGTVGEYEMKTKVKYPKKRKYEMTIDTPGGMGQLDLPTPPGQTVGHLIFKGDRSSGVLPVPLSVVDPSGADSKILNVRLRKNKAKAKFVVFDGFGLQQIRFEAENGTMGPVKLKVKGLKYEKHPNRMVFDSEILIPPTPLTMTPSSGYVNEVVEDVVVTGTFFQIGAEVFMRKGDTMYRVTDVLVLDAKSLQFDLDVTEMGLGTWDLVVENFDKGRGEIENAFTVLNVPADVETITPTSGRDDQVVNVVITGSQLQPGAEVKLIRDGEEIMAENVQVLVPIQEIHCRFDLRNRTNGFWDLEVTNRESLPDVLPDAFTIENAPPTIEAFSPDRTHDPAGNVVCAIEGTGFEDGLTVRLTRPGESPIFGAVGLVTPGSITVNFNVLDRETGLWDVSVSNPDGQTAALSEVFLVLGAVGSIVTNSIDSYALNTPAVAYNADDEEFLFVWVQKDGSDNYTVKAQRFDAATGKAIGSAVELLTKDSGEDASDVRFEPSVAWSSDDNVYCVAWVERLPDGKSEDEDQVWAQVLDNDLKKIGSALQVTDRNAVNTSVLEDQHNGRPSVAYDASDGTEKFIIAFEHHWLNPSSSSNPAFDWDVIFRWIDPTSAVLDKGAAFGPNMSGNREYQPAGIYSEKRGWMMAFVESTDNTNSDPKSSAIHLGTETTDAALTSGQKDAYPWIAYADDKDEGLAVWVRDETDIMARRFDSSLAGNGDEFSVAAGSSEVNRDPRIVWNPVLEEYLIVWTRITSSGVSVMARRYGWYQTAAQTTSKWQLLGSAFTISDGEGKEAFGMPLFQTDDEEYLVPWVGGVSRSGNDILGTGVSSRRWK